MLLSKKEKIRLKSKKFKKNDKIRIIMILKKVNYENNIFIVKD